MHVRVCVRACVRACVIRSHLASQVLLHPLHSPWLLRVMSSTLLQKEHNLLAKLRSWAVENLDETIQKTVSVSTEVNRETALAAADICLTEVRTLFDLNIFTVHSFEEHDLQQQTELLRQDALNVASFVNQAMSDTIDRYHKDGILMPCRRLAFV